MNFDSKVSISKTKVPNAGFGVILVNRATEANIQHVQSIPSVGKQLEEGYHNSFLCSVCDYIPCLALERRTKRGTFEPGHTHGNRAI